jgi:hypothetical protein
MLLLNEENKFLSESKFQLCIIKRERANHLTPSMTLVKDGRKETEETEACNKVIVRPRT